mgnify:CR=1 FL=1|tara:strand:- start:1276 stop:1461 length:186 start_codon:yes stop_codon:yes gene_type:complete
MAKLKGSTMFVMWACITALIITAMITPVFTGLGLAFSLTISTLVGFAFIVQHHENKQKELK